MPETGTGNGPRPLILFYHGTGEIGNDPTIITKSSPFRYILEQGDLPCFIAAPQLAPDQREFAEEFLDRFLKEIMARYPVDSARVTVTGLSLGGYAVWRFAGSHPEKIAAFAPLSVSVPRLADYIRPEAAAGLKGKPVWIINGVKDTIFPIASARSTAAEATRAGMAVRYTEMADADHDTWTKTYSDRAFFDWLLAQQLR